jgi:ribosomal protein L37E
MSNYPVGAWEDKNAPWNEILCPRCGEHVEETVNNYWREAKCVDCGWELDYFLE